MLLITTQAIITWKHLVGLKEGSVTCVPQFMKLHGNKMCQGHMARSSGIDHNIYRGGGACIVLKKQLCPEIR